MEPERREPKEASFSARNLDLRKLDNLGELAVPCCGGALTQHQLLAQSAATHRDIGPLPSLEV